MFSSRYSVKQIKTLYGYSGNSFERCVECLSNNASKDDILKVTNEYVKCCRSVKVSVDSNDVWSDMLAFYKESANLAGTRIRVVLDDSPVIDMCGVRKQVYTTVFESFAQNSTKVRLFEGAPNFIRPLYTPEATCSGLFKVLGRMIGHSILQDGIGFLYISPTCYLYMVDGEHKAFDYACIDDVGEDTAVIVTKVSFVC